MGIPVLCLLLLLAAAQGSAQIQAGEYQVLRAAVLVQRGGVCTPKAALPSQTLPPLLHPAFGSRPGLRTSPGSPDEGLTALCPQAHTRCGILPPLSPVHCRGLRGRYAVHELRQRRGDPEGQALLTVGGTDGVGVLGGPDAEIQEGHTEFSKVPSEHAPPLQTESEW